MTREPEQTKPNGFGLTRKQAEAIPFLIGARSLEEGRQKAKVSKTQLYKWLKDETFKTELDRQREAIIVEAMDRLKASMGKAVEVLTGLMDAKEKNIKIRAAERVIEFFIKAKEMDVERRLTELERQFQKR